MAVAPLRTGPGLVSSAAARMVSSVSDKQNLKKREGSCGSALSNCVLHALLRNKFRETPKTYRRTSLYSVFGQRRFSSLHSHSNFGNDLSVYADTLYVDRGFYR